MFVVQKDFQTFNQKFKAGQELKPDDVLALPAWAVEGDFLKEVPGEVAIKGVPAAAVVADTPTQMPDADRSPTAQTDPAFPPRRR